MKITPQDAKLASLHALNPASERVAERKATAQPGASTAGEASATVQLSEAAQLAAKSLDANFDAEKVERMSQAIRDGSFKVDAGAVADKLIANAREQLAKTYR
jgi:negative regulator of flagellin synthesis FlgM